MLSKNAVGNLINKYRTVLAHCKLMNVFGTLAVAVTMAGSLMLTADQAQAATPNVTVTTEEYTDDNKNNYYTTYGVPYYDSDAETYQTQYYGVLIKLGEEEYTDISNLLIDAVTGTTIDGTTIDGTTIDGTTIDGTYEIGTDPVSNTPSFTITVDEQETTFYVTYASGGALATTSVGSRESNPSSIKDEVFIGNVADYGGAIYNYSNSTITTISGSYFIGNEASSGGAIYNNSGTIGDTTSSTTTGIINSYFIGNEASSGGAIRNNSNSNSNSTITTISGSYFIGNSAVHSGGAIYNYASSSLNTATATATITTISGSYFIGNEASSGGAIANYAFASGTATATIGEIANCIFIGNSASYGGAIVNYAFADGGTATATITTISGSYFIGNEASYGGAIYNNGGTITTISGSTFIGNEATYSGGAIYNYAFAFSGTATASIESITNCIFTGNSAGTSGGAIYTNQDLDFVDDSRSSVFSNNYMDTDDGIVYNAIYTDGGDLTFTMTDGGSFVMNDSIMGSATYTVEIEGDSDGDDVENFYLNDAIDEYGTVTVTNATLTLGSYTHDDGSITYGAVLGSLTINSSAALVVNITNTTGTATVASLSLSGGTLTVSSGTLDVSGDNDLSFTTGTTSTITIEADGILKADLEDFGTVNVTDAAVTGFTADNTYTFSSTSTGTLNLDATGYTVDKSNYSTLVSSIGYSGTLVLNCTLTGLYTLEQGYALAEDGIFDEVVSHGKLDDYQTLTVSGLQQSDTDSNTTTSTINSTSSLTLTGTTDGVAVSVLNGGTITNSGELIVGLGDGQDLTAIGDFETTGTGTTTFNNDITITGNVTNSYITTFNGYVDLSGTLAITQGIVYINDGGTFTDVDSSGSLTITGTALIADYTDYTSTAHLLVSGSTGIDSITDASKVSLSITDETLNGMMTVGSNAYVVLGDGTDAELIAAETTFAEYDLTWGTGNMAAALFLNGAYSLASTGKLYVGTATGDTVSAGMALFQSDSLLVVNTASLGDDDTALTASYITANSGASLLITSGGISFTDVDTVTVKIAEATDANSLTINEGAWGYSGTTTGYDAESLYLDTSFMQVDSINYDDELNTYSITVSALAGADVFGDTVNADLAELMAEVAKNGSDANKAFVEELANSTPEEAEGVHKLSASGAVSQSVGAASTAFTGAISQRIAVSSASEDMGSFDAANTSTYLAMNGDALVVPFVDSGRMAQGFALWAMPIFNYTSADGFKSGNFSYGFDSVLYGLSMGGDYTFAHDFRLGLAFSAGRGSAESTGDFAKTENDFDFYGLTLYGLKRFGNLGLSFDLGYMKSENEVVQDASFGHMHADMDAELITAALKAEYLIRRDGVNLTPYAGVRVNYYAVDGYDGYWNGVAQYHSARENHTIVEFPLGVSVDTTYEVDGWTLTPHASLGVKYAVGDLDAEHEVSYEGVAGSVVLSSEVADAVTFQGALGLGMKMGDYSLDLGYSLDLSENMESHGVMLNMRYAF